MELINETIAKRCTFESGEPHRNFAFRNDHAATLGDIEVSTTVAPEHPNTVVIGSELNGEG